KVGFVVSTHYHPDHIGGNKVRKGLFGGGPMIIGHQLLRDRLEKANTDIIKEGDTSLPGKTYLNNEGISVQFGNRVVQVAHIPNAHTDGDSYAWFADANVLSTGDTVYFGLYPGFDAAAGGTFAGMIAAADKYVAITNADSKIVPGHGPVGTRAMLVEYRQML